MPKDNGGDEIAGFILEMDDGKGTRDFFKNSVKPMYIDYFWQKSYPYRQVVVIQDTITTIEKWRFRWSFEGIFINIYDLLYSQIFIAATDQVVSGWL